MSEIALGRMSLTSSRRLQSEVDQGRRHLSATREEAVKVEANRLASNLFGAAAARERDGEQQAKDGRLAAALETMRDAAARYEEAGRAARVIGVERARADQARALMLAAKERAAREAPGFKEALARESEGDSRYGELAFEDAAKRFAAAARLFAAVPPMMRRITCWEWRCRRLGMRRKDSGRRIWRSGSHRRMRSGKRSQRARTPSREISSASRCSSMPRARRAWRT